MMNPLDIEPLQNLAPSRNHAIQPVTAAPLAGRPADEAPRVLTAGPGPLDLLDALRRRWLLASVGGLTLAVLAGLAAYHLVPPSKYTARSMLQVSSMPPRVIFETKENVSDFRTYQRTQLTLVKSRKVLSSALERPEVVRFNLGKTQRDPVAWLDTEMKADFPGGSEILVISMAGEQPDAVTALVNAVTDSYLRLIVDEEQRERVARFDRLKSLFNRLHSDLTEKRKTYRRSIETVGMNDKQSLALKQQLAVEHLGQAKQDLLQIQGELRKAEIQMKLQQPEGEEPRAPRAEFAEISERDPQVVEHLRRQADLTARLARARRILRGGTDPSVKALLDQIREEKRGLDQRRDQLRREYEAQIARGDRPQQESVYARSRRYYEILKQQEDVLRGKIAALDGELKSSNVKSLDMHWLEDEIALAGDAAKMVGTEVESLNVELQAPPRIRLIEKAEAPILKDPLRKAKLGGLSAFGALALFVGAVTFLEFRSRKIGRPDEVVKGLGIRLVGSLPALPQPGRSRGTDAWQRLLIESVDATRTMLLHASRKDSIRTVMIASAVKGEGKTSLACHLAASLARANQRTLLVDCDLRCPSVHRVLGVEKGAGASELLRGEARPDDVIRATGAVGLDLITAGRGDLAAIQALADTRMRGILDEIGDRYDFIIVDSAPLLVVPDSLMLCQHVDAAIFSILREVSRVPRVHAAHERLRTLGVRILGAVIAGTPESSYEYGYDYAMQPAGPGQGVGDGA